MKTIHLNSVIDKLIIQQKFSIKNISLSGAKPDNFVLSWLLLDANP